MAKVTREMVERSGINVDQLVELLVKNTSAEQIGRASCRERV